MDITIFFVIIISLSFVCFVYYVFAMLKQAKITNERLLAMQENFSNLIIASQQDMVKSFSHGNELLNLSIMEKSEEMIKICNEMKSNMKDGVVSMNNDINAGNQRIKDSLNEMNQTNSSLITKIDSDVAKNIDELNSVTSTHLEKIVEILQTNLQNNNASLKEGLNKIDGTLKETISI